LTTPCKEEKHCYYNDYHNSSKYCRILTTKDEKIPYESGKCPYYKKTEHSYSGSYEGEEYSKEMLKKIDSQELDYKARHGIISDVQARRRSRDE
jgi:hypothetical protein